MKTNKMAAIIGNLRRYEDLMPLIEHRPISTLPFDAKYRLIDFNLSNIANANVKSVFMIFNNGELRSVFDHIGGGNEWNLDGVQNRFFMHNYSDFSDRGDNNAGYYDVVLDYLRKSKSEYTVYMNSNILCNIDLRALLQIHQSRDCDMTVVYKKVPKEIVYQGDIVLQLDDEHTIADKKVANKIELSEIVNLCTDIFILRTDLLMEILEEKKASGTYGFIEGSLRQRIDHNTNAYEYTGYLSNIFDISSYYNANMDMLDNQKFNSLLYSSQKVYTKIKNEVPTYYTKSSVVNNSQFATGCIIEGQVENSLVGRDAIVEEGAKVEASILFPSAKIETNAIVDHAILDKNVHVAHGVRIVGTKEKPIVIQKGINVTEDILGGK